MGYMTVIDLYRIIHRITTAQVYRYEEILEMLPYERDISMALLIEDAEKQKIENNPNAFV